MQILSRTLSFSESTAYILDSLTFKYKPQKFDWELVVLTKPTDIQEDKPMCS